MGTGAPATAMYASPMVLIFSRPCRSAIWSNRRNSSSSAAANSSGDDRAPCSVDPTASAKTTVTWSKLWAIRAAGGGLELLDDGLRQDVQQQAVGSLPLLVDLALAQEHLSREPFQSIGGQPAQDPERDQVEGREHPGHVDDVLRRERVRKVGGDADHRDQHDEDEPEPQQGVGERRDQDDADVAVLGGQRQDVRDVVDPHQERRRRDDDRHPLPDAPEEAA